MAKKGDSQIVGLAVRLGVNAAALWVASEVLGDRFEIDGWQSLLALAAIFGVINAFIKPVAQLAGCPLSVITLGLFALVINAGMLALAVWIGDVFDLSVHMEDFWAALFAALIVSIVSWLLSTFVGRPVKWAMR